MFDFAIALRDLWAHLCHRFVTGFRSLPSEENNSLLPFFLPQVIDYQDFIEPYKHFQTITMSRKTLSTIVALCFLHTAFSQIVFVKEGATGRGTSWQDATGDLRKALYIAKPGARIWVAEGIYYPVNCEECTPEDRLVSFEIPSGVRVYGGFAGTETHERQRKWRENVTTFSGNIGREDYFDNSYSVIFTKNADATTLVDGIVVADGNADNESASAGEFTRAGGGWFNEGSGSGNRSNPSLNHIVFLANMALEGAGMFNNGAAGGESSPNLFKCVFTMNRALYGGGGIFNNGVGGVCKPVVIACQFVSNEAAFGAGMFNASADMPGEASMKECAFVNNKARKGSCLFFLGSKVEPVLRSSRFVNNVSEDGKEVVLTSQNALPQNLTGSVSKDGLGM